MESNLTSKSLSDNNTSVIIDIVDNNKTLIVVFGGIASKLPIPVFEFLRSLDKYHTNKVFIRDFHQAWYQKGLKGITGNVEETIRYLEKIINDYTYNKLVFLGNSAGGYGAMLYGWLLNVHEIHAFAPQTFTNKVNRFFYKDNRWKAQISILHENSTSNKYQDLKKLQRYIQDTKTYIYWDKHDRLDNIHVKRLKHNGIIKRPYSKGGHNLIKVLKENGELNKILDSTLNYA